MKMVSSVKKTTIPEHPRMGFLLLIGVILLLPSTQSWSESITRLSISDRTTIDIAPGGKMTWETEAVGEGEVLHWQAEIPRFDLEETDWIHLRLSADGQSDVTKELNAGDRTLFVPVQIKGGGPVRIAAISKARRDLPLRLSIQPFPLSKEELLAFETEPNNNWREAIPMKVGRTVYGNNDDTDYLDNKDEVPIKGYANGLDNPRRARPGLDWFKIDFNEADRALAIFELDVLDRDVSVNLRTYVENEKGDEVVLFTEGKDPMEIIHDREPERYSKSISRILERDKTYYLQVIGNHPRYILRSKIYDVPPYQDPEKAVQTGAHYIMNVGDAWVAQVPREGNIYRRVQNMHDTALRCTACHPSIFSTEAVLTAQKAGYPIEAKSNFRYVVDRIYNGPTPLYGPFNVNWQRYIAIPMQSQGKHGLILKDFENYVSGRETGLFGRYAPFLRHAWTGMEDLHEDEQNGVVPRDSNVGFAVRDWLVLEEAERRGGERAYGEAADTVREIVTGERCNLKNIQDKLHRIWGFSVMEETEDEFQVELDAAIEEILSFQNDDGGWPDVVEPGRSSAVYTTGQVLWTLAQAGRNLENTPPLRKGVGYILKEQKDFGGWFQTSTHENFRTPMRETRYSVMALAALHPREGAPIRGWGNRDGDAARLPGTGSVLDTLDDLDNLWEVSEDQRETYTQALVYLLTHEEPLIRSTAAETLGRVGTETAIEPLLSLLSDPIKDVWRSAAWALRQFGNRGLGLEKIKAALSGEDPAARRGAVRIFAYHYFGMDQRLDIAKEIMKLTDDDNLWTRLEALKTLRQWFYRTGENAFKREVVDLYIGHMGRPEHSAIRTNLAQGMYIMLDENEAGGVSLERNIARFPYERDRDTVIDARRHVEQSILLEPVLEGLASGNRSQREALLASFDGSFFAGRFYARNPRNMIDVGNDREFSFYYEPPQHLLDRVFRNLFNAELSTQHLKQAIQLAGFFFVPNETEDPEVQLALLKLVRHPDGEIRETALKFVNEELALKGAGSDESFNREVVGFLKDPNHEVQAAVLSAIRRNDALLHHEAVKAYVDSALQSETDRGRLLPVLDSDLLSNVQALEIYRSLWNGTKSDEDRLRLVGELFRRSQMVDIERPSLDLVRLLKIISVDDVTAVREELVKRLSETERLGKSPMLGRVLHSGFSDASAGIRLKTLQLAQDQDSFWKDADTIEYVLRLLVDPDPKIRDLALASVEKFDLLSFEPRFAKRVKPLVGDPKLGERAVNLLASKGFDPDEIEGDGAIQAFGVPDLESFVEKVNPYFYEVGADGHSCYECHQNHNILRIAEKPDGSVGLPEDLIIQNFNSVLKVVNLGDPEQSLILRKPRSPEGQGEARDDSPTGLTHVGGPRWPSKTHPGYQSILSWIQDAASSQKRRLAKSALADSYSPEYPPELALDGNPQTIWHTEFVGAMPGYPHEITLDLGEVVSTSVFQYVPRQDSENGRVKEWELYVSADGEEWGNPVSTGEWENDAAVKTVPLRQHGIRYVKFKGLESVDGKPYMSAAEVIVLRAKGEGPEEVARVN